MTSLLIDLRYGVRMMLRHPAVTAAAVTTMAIAIAANTAIFTLVYNVLLRPLPLPDPDRIVRIEERHTRGRLNLTGATFSDLKERATSLRAVASYRIMSPGLSDGSSPQQVLAAEVSADYFAVLGVGPAAGAGFTSEDFAPGAPRAVLLSDGLWRGRFGAAAGILGTQVLIDALPARVAGIMPSTFFAPGTPDIWMPQPPSPLLLNRRAHLFTVIARLGDGVSLETSRQELTATASAIVRDSGAIDPEMTLLSMPLQARLVEGARPAILLIWGAVALVLFVAAANVANLLLMQGTVRTRELSVRSALGAGRARLVRQLATESLLLGLTGGALGTTLGIWAVPALEAALPRSIPRPAAMSADASVAAFGIVLSIAAALLFGILPTLRRSLGHPIEALRSRADTGTPRSRGSAVLVMMEVALTVMLLSGAALLGQSLASVLRTDPGFDTNGVVTFTMSLPAAKYGDARAHDDFYRRVLERISTLEGIQAAGVTGALPLSGTPATTMEPERTTTRGDLAANVITASPGFFSAMGIPLKRGRLFASADNSTANAGSTEKGGHDKEVRRKPDATGQRVLLINETAARQFWPDGMDPIGRRITMKDWGDPYTAVVVGVVGDVHQSGPDGGVAPSVYYPFAQFPETTLSESVVVRASGNVERTIAAVREQIAAVDRDQAVAAVRTMDDVLSASVAPRRFNLAVVAFFAAAALILAAIGVYGIVAFAVGQRAREIAVRMAVGARASDISKLVLAHGAAPVAAGLVAGLAGALAASGLLQGLLFGVQAADPLTLCCVSALVGVAAAAACVAPVRRAMRIDPAVALRGES